MASNKQSANNRQQELQARAQEHLWLQFADNSQYQPRGDKQLPIIERGQGCYLFDINGQRYLDGLSALFCVQVGHGRPEIAAAIAAQAEQLEFVTLWSYAHQPAIDLAARIAELAPGDLNKIFFTSGGAESVESAIKLARAYHRARGQSQKTKFIARQLAYHGTTLGALSATGLSALRNPFEPLAPGGCHVPATNLYRQPHGPDGQGPESFAQAIEQRVLFEGPETVAAVILEPVQNAGGCFVPPDGYFQQVREICDRYDLLLISDETICAWGRLGTYFGCQRLGYQPDIITTAKGLTSAYQPMGAMIVSDQVAEPFFSGEAFFAHGFTFSGHPLAAAAAQANLDIFATEKLPERVIEHEPEFRATLEQLRDIPIVGDVRGLGYFQALELVKDQKTKETFTSAECDWLLRDFLSEQLYGQGLICRADDRGDPVIQLAPPLIAGAEEFAIIGRVLRQALTAASQQLGLK